jgi:hypothetical protein
MTVRDDVRQHFEREAVRHPVPPGLRATAQVHARGRVIERRSAQWIAGAVAALLAVAIIAGLVAVGGYRRAHNAPAVRPSPSTSPLHPTAKGPIPTGVPVVLYWRTVTADGLYAASWSGAVYKLPTLPIYEGLAVQSPDGSRVALGFLAYDTTTGAQQPLPFGPNPSVTVSWADDSRHLCLVRVVGGDGSPSDISVGLPGSPETKLARLGVNAQQSPGPTVLSCSYINRKVVVAQVGFGRDTHDLWVLNWDTGAVEYHRTYRVPTKYGVIDGTFTVASPDAQYVAETDAVTGSATIRRLADDTVVAHLDGEEVHGFSWHGDRVLATPRLPNVDLVNGATTDPAVIDWRTGKTVWQSPVGAAFRGRLAAQPGGSGIALDLRSGVHGAIWMIGSDGTGRQVDADIDALVTGLVGLV